MQWTLIIMSAFFITESCDLSYHQGETYHTLSRVKKVLMIDRTVMASTNKRLVSSVLSSSHSCERVVDIHTNFD